MPQQRRSLTRYWTELFLEFFSHFRWSETEAATARSQHTTPTARGNEASGGGDRQNERAVRRRGGNRKHKGLFKLMKKKTFTTTSTALKSTQRPCTAGMGCLNEEAAEIECRTAEAEQDVEQLEEAEAKNKAIKEDERALERIRGDHQARMAILRKAALELYAAESAEVKAEMGKETAERNTARAGAEVDDGERSPQQFQNGIEQLGDVLTHVSDAIEEETGWQGWMILGGPALQREGAVTIKIFCFGSTPDGDDFATGFDSTTIRTELIQYLKRAFRKFPNSTPE
ncbi:hypothetical protein B0H14DRAFT_2632384 [Mycena olivaceomarginata]|nr:hypothetical protein B0H14DRAFT_2632384 [Mycena olivaceomarginata]